MQSMLEGLALLMREKSRDIETRKAKEVGMGRHSNQGDEGRTHGEGEL